MHFYFELRSQRVRRRRRFARREFGLVGIMTGNAIHSRDWPAVAIPITAGPSVCATLPIAVSGTVAASAERSAFGELQLAPVAGLEQLEVRFVVAIETEIVPIMAAMAHYDVRMFFGNDQIVLLVETHSGSFVALVTGV